MKIKTIGKHIVPEDLNWGVYVLQMPDGAVVVDDDDNFLCVTCRKHDLGMLKKLMDAARYYGVGEATPKFLPGRRGISDEEFEQQLERQAMGLVPDPNEAGSMLDELRGWRL